VVRALPKHSATIRRILFDALTPEQQDALLGIARTMNAAIDDEECAPPADCDD
jgi:hypothetical protein